MNNRNLPIAISFAFLNIFLLVILLQFYFTHFFECNVYAKISMIFIGISVFLNCLFQSLFHWITKNDKTLTALKVLSRITSILLISSILLSYSFCILSGAIKWVSFGLICLFFSFCIIIFSIWTKMPFFLSEIFKDINLTSVLIFFPIIIIKFLQKNSTSLIILSILSLLLYIVSMVLKYIYSLKESLNTYNIHKYLNILVMLLQLYIITHYFV